MATTNFMRPTWETFYDLEAKNLTIFAQYTAAPWEYIGTQGVIEGTFETLAAVGIKHYDGHMENRILLTAGAVSAAGCGFARFGLWSPLIIPMSLQMPAAFVIASAALNWV